MTYCKDLTNYEYSSARHQFIIKNVGWLDGEIDFEKIKHNDDGRTAQ
jgi:hypothetical protein